MMADLATLQRLIYNLNGSVRDGSASSRRI